MSENTEYDRQTQEMAQERNYPLPTCELKQLRETPPLFRCTVTTFDSKRRQQFDGHSANKQAAKVSVATLALDQRSLA